MKYGDIVVYKNEIGKVVTDEGVFKFKPCNSGCCYYSSLDTITEEDVRVLLESAYVQVLCNDPSFHWQGSNWAATQLDASVYPTEIAPRVWNSPKLHGDSGGRMSNFLCKHLTGLINQIGFFIPKIRDIIIKIQKKFQIDL